MSLVQAGLWRKSSWPVTPQHCSRTITTVHTRLTSPPCNNQSELSIAGHQSQATSPQHSSSGPIRDEYCSHVTSSPPIPAHLQHGLHPDAGPGPRVLGGLQHPGPQTLQLRLQLVDVSVSLPLPGLQGKPERKIDKRCLCFTNVCLEDLKKPCGKRLVLIEKTSKTAFQ